MTRTRTSPNVDIYRNQSRFSRCSACLTLLTCMFTSYRSSATRVTDGPSPPRRDVRHCPVGQIPDSKRQSGTPTTSALFADVFRPFTSAPADRATETTEVRRCARRMATPLSIAVTTRRRLRQRYRGTTGPGLGRHRNSGGAQDVRSPSPVDPCCFELGLRRSGGAEGPRRLQPTPSGVRPRPLLCPPRDHAANAESSRRPCPV